MRYAILKILVTLRRIFLSGFSKQPTVTFNGKALRTMKAHTRNGKSGYLIPLRKSDLGKTADALKVVWIVPPLRVRPWLMLCHP